MFQNLKTRNAKESKYKNLPMDYPNGLRGFHSNPRSSTNATQTQAPIKGNEAERLVRCRTCGFPCDKERDSKSFEGSWAGLGVDFGSEKTANSSPLSDGRTLANPATLPPSILSTIDQAQQPYNKLMLHFNGSNGSTSFTDNSSMGYAITANGDVQISTTQSKFGGASGLFDGTGDYISIPDSDDWNYVKLNFTIDFWIYFTADPTTNRGIMDQRSDDNNVFEIYVANAGKLRLTVVSSGIGIVNVRTTNTIFSINNWYHVSVIRYGIGANNILMFINGVSQALTFDTGLSANATMPDISAPFRIGITERESVLMTGYIDEFKVTKGYAIWTSNFTPPTEETFTLHAPIYNAQNPDKYYNRSVVGGCPCCGDLLYYLKKEN